ncbi:2-polyprenyl-6-hydroxyphenyl methylase / 3-demethylubiquinone-9 3-methyltransferase [Sphingopyxis terrae subsp. ummariensis]|uniref:2-polyprenyl-6-hydroxyphenyl methylase / 3-demethylubiquinone-9 3-methyltransferase n=2 Tax=Sphingopyxis terrae TaxID=33052 RepID=A0A1Y6FPE5_9SPHN|nr:2-polyprenyl-6-hydroxyphenyl methylase / 3-demethylubiquinone-9 3-methyltransferase [Sphingopyxis terrae subsp. ummariensis]
MGLARVFIDMNVRLSRAIDGLLPSRLRRDGNRTFLADFAPHALQPGAVLYDVGGGSQPFVNGAAKQQYDMTVIGLDISADEMANAPAGIYDRMIATDLCTYRGDGDADVVMCQATMEHVPDGAGAIAAIASILKPGGRAFIFAPSRNALFARLNLLLPQAVKEKILFALFPAKATGHDGFPAFYDNCTPRQIAALAAKNGLVVEQRVLFWTSSYFTIFVPAYLVWRAYQGLSYLFRGDNAAETFIFVLAKPPKVDDAR